MSEILNKAREYEEKYSAYIREEERPQFHLTPRVGWMNDPNGFSVYQGKYHIFYQYHPYNTQWGPMHWGHAVSDDFIHWEDLPVAIAPDMPYDKDGCFSGSAVELDDGRHLLMYTGVKRERGEDGIMRDLQTQCIAVGDGVNYVKYEGNPVLTGADVPKGFSENDFRDPKIFRNADGSFGCVVGNRTDDGSGAILLFTSKDGFQWEFDSILDRSYNEFGKMWECPDMFSIGDTALIVTSPQDMRALGMEFHSGNCTMALMGGVLGSGIALACMNPVIEMLREAFKLSPSVWSTQLALLCGAAGILLAAVLGFAAAVTPAVKSASMDPQAAITQGEVN